MSQTVQIVVNEFEKGLLHYLSEEQLAKIQSMKIGIGGAGGLGSNVAMILTRCGFKHFEILDQDVVDASNLNRQQYYLEEIGDVKVQITKNRLLAINPDLEMAIYQTQWRSEDGDKYFKGCDFIVEAFDQMDRKFQFVDFYHDKAKYLVSGIGMAGLTEKKPMKVRKLGNVYFVGDGQTCSHKGHPPMAPRVTACSAMMAEIILDLTLEI